jgi:hypothetical protein
MNKGANIIAVLTLSGLALLPASVQRADLSGCVAADWVNKNNK